jgi:hypothetical protein
MNMARMVLSAERVALPVRTAPPSPFLSSITANHTMSDPGDAPDAALRHRRAPKLIKCLVALEACGRGCNLYIRPTLIATQPSPGVSTSRHAALYVFLSPTGSYIRGTNNSSDAAGGQGGIAQLTMGSQIRAWPSGMGGFKLGLNYAPGFASQCPTAVVG